MELYLRCEHLILSFSSSVQLVHVVEFLHQDNLQVIWRDSIKNKIIIINYIYLDISPTKPHQSLLTRSRPFVSHERFKIPFFSSTTIAAYFFFLSRSSFSKKPSISSSSNLYRSLTFRFKTLPTSNA